MEAVKVRFLFNVRIANGTVERYGGIMDLREQTALRILIENVPGMKEVCNLLDRITKARTTPGG